MQTADERRREILARVRTRRSVKVGALSAELGVTPETIRTDLVELDEQGLVQRVHGGATAVPNQETAYERRRHLHTEAKQAIASAAIELTTTAKTVYIDYGTTAFHFAQLLAAADPSITVVTNSLPTVNALLPCSNLEIVMPGGHVRRNENSLDGPITDSAISRLFFDVGFFGCAGIAASSGVTNYHFAESAVSSLAMSHCQTVVLLADESKIGQTATVQMTTLEMVDHLVTDTPPDDEFRAALEDAGCALHIATLPTATEENS
jgi:DeoR family glycerol-3-phosphate regulon repressor